jgi:drug/metabolite transporter (DMT)-like permease
MNNWYLLSVISLLLLGTQRFLYKVSAERKCSTAWTTFAFMGTVTVLSSILFFVSNTAVANIPFLLFIACVNGSAFVLGTITHIEALKCIPASVAYPIIRLNAVIVIVFSIVFFDDHVSVYQVLGIILALTVIVLLSRQAEDQNPSTTNRRRGFVLVAIALLAGAVASISSKFAAVYTNKMAFMAVSYLLGTLFSFGLTKRNMPQDTNPNHKDALFIGCIMGLINFVGFYSFLKALSLGPLSIIVSITGLHFVIAILLAVLIYKEPLTPRRVLAILLTIMAVIFLRL